MSRSLTVGSLFAGIGGFELGLERAGMEIAWHCESDSFCQRVLEKHWPGSPIFDDVCTLTAGPLNPTWAEWFMGFPIGWTELLPSETP